MEVAYLVSVGQIICHQLKSLVRFVVKEVLNINRWNFNEVYASKNLTKECEISDSHGNEYEVDNILVYSWALMNTVTNCRVL
jgi:hypothetical protein